MLCLAVRPNHNPSLPPHTIPLGHPLYIKAVNFFLSILLSAAAKSRQSCLTLCDHIDGSPPGSSVPEILEARTLEWVAISFSSAWKWKVKGKSLSRVWLLATPWTTAYQAPLSVGFPRQKYWSGVPLPSPLLSATALNYFNVMWVLSWTLWDFIGTLMASAVETVSLFPYIFYVSDFFRQVISANTL